MIIDYVNRPRPSRGKIWMKRNRKAIKFGVLLLLIVTIGSLGVS